MISTFNKTLWWIICRCSIDLQTEIQNYADQEEYTQSHSEQSRVDQIVSCLAEFNSKLALRRMRPILQTSKRKQFDGKNVLCLFSWKVFLDLYVITLSVFASETYGSKWNESLMHICINYFALLCLTLILTEKKLV